MVKIQINAKEYELCAAEVGIGVVLKGTDSPNITLIGDDGADQRLLSQGQLPNEVLRFLTDFPRKMNERLEQLRAETASRLWSEYAEGPYGGWRAAGDTNEPDIGSFGIALGKIVDVTIILENEMPTIMELWWENRSLFLGHSILTTVHDLENWSELEVTLFG